MNAAALTHCVELMRRKRPRWMMGEAPHHAVLIVDGHEGMAVERVVAIGRDHGVKRHDPLRDPPIKLLRPCWSPHPDHHAAAGFNDFESGIGLARELRAFADVQWIVAQIVTVQKRYMHGIDAAFERLQPIAFLYALRHKAVPRWHGRPFEIR